MPRDNRPTTNVRIYESTLDAIRDEQNRMRKQTRSEPTYAQLIHTAWQKYESDKVISQETQAIPEFAYNPADKRWHDRLDTILRSQVELIILAIQQNLHGFESAVKTIQSLWDLGDLPTDLERELITQFMRILRAGTSNSSLRRQMLVTLLADTSDPLSAKTQQEQEAIQQSLEKLKTLRSSSQTLASKKIK